jgi:probable HAF family extracellular repeat protein
MIDLGTFGGGHSAPKDVDAFGQVLGSAYTSEQRPHAFLWTETGGLVDLGTLGGAKSTASAFNAEGLVVGESECENGDDHAVLWRRAYPRWVFGLLGGAALLIVAAVVWIARHRGGHRPGTDATIRRKQISQPRYRK